MIKAIYDALCEIADTEQITEQVTEQVEKLLEVIDVKNGQPRSLWDYWD